MRSIEWGSSKKRDPTEGNFFTGQKPGAVQQFGATSVCENPLVGAQTLRSGLGRGCACCKKLWSLYVRLGSEFRRVSQRLFFPSPREGGRSNAFFDSPPKKVQRGLLGYSAPDDITFMMAR